MSLFKKTLLQCLAVVAVGGVFCAGYLTFEKIEWQKFIFTDTTMIACGLLTLLGVLMPCYALKHKTENISHEAEETIRWLLFAMMSLLFLGILACVFCNPGAVAAAISFAVVCLFLMKVLTGKTYGRGEKKRYNEMVACFAILLVILSLYCVIDFANHEYMKGNAGFITLPFVAVSTVSNIFNSNKRACGVNP